MIEIKKATTIDEQINLLRSRGLIITNIEKTTKFMKNVNYYMFTGYLYDFRKDNNTYVDGISFDKIYNIYQCDKRIKNIIMYAIETIEQSIKTRIAYNFAHQIGELKYLTYDPKIFKYEKQHNLFIKKFNQTITNNQKVPFVKHHKEKYNGQFPIWVAVELFTLGMVRYFYKNLISKYQKIISREFNLNPIQFESWIENVTYLRNLSAHYMRLYNFNLEKTPKKNPRLFDEDYQVKHKIYDILYIMKFLYPDKNEWNYYILTSFQDIFDLYQEFIDIDAYGFNEYWLRQLSK